MFWFGKPDDKSNQNFKKGHYDYDNVINNKLNDEWMNNKLWTENAWINNLNS